MQLILLRLMLELVCGASGLSDAEVASAQEGKVPTRTEAFVNAHGKSVGRGLGAIVIQRPLATVWATLARFEDRAEYVPRLKSVAVLERHPGRLRVRQEIDATVRTVVYTAWFDVDEAQHTIHWKLDDGARDNGIADVDGEYRLCALGPASTLLAYRAFLDSGIKVPRFIQSYLALRSIPNLLDAIKRRVESGGSWKKP